MFRRQAVLLICACVGLLARGSALTPGNILYTTDFSTSPQMTLYEATTGGTKLQSFTIPYPGGNRNSTEDLRDIVVGHDGKIQIFNGTFSPYLTTLDPATSTYSHHAGAGFSVAGNVSYGGVAISGNYAFVPDENVNGSPANGVVRFDTTDYSSQRFLSGKDYEKVSIGADGLLYVLTANESLGWPGVEVYDPVSMAPQRTVVFTGKDIRAVTATANGDLFAADWGGTLYHLDSTGNTIASRALGLGNLSDMDLSPTGQIVVAGGGTKVGLTDVNLTTPTSFNVSNVYFVAFTSPIPEPASLTLMLSVSLLGKRPRRKSFPNSSCCR